MRHRPILALGLVLILGGCASAPRPAYQPPASGPSASLQLINATEGRASVAIYGNAARCTGRRYIPDLLAGERTTVAISADEPTAFTFGYQVPNTRKRTFCHVTASFRPEAGQLYQAVLEPGEPACRLEVARLVAGQPVRLGATQRIAREDGDAAGGYCLPLE